MRIKDGMRTKAGLLIVLSEALEVDELGVPAVAMHQLGVCALLDNPALVKHIDNVCLLNRAQTVCHSNGRATLGSLVKGSLHHLFTLAVEGRCSFIKETRGALLVKYSI